MKMRERRITIPKHLLQKYGLREDDEVELVPEKNGILIQKQPKETHSLKNMAGIVKLPDGLTVDEYIEEIRGR